MNILGSISYDMLPFLFINLLDGAGKAYTNNYIQLIFNQNNTKKDYKFSKK